MSEPAETRIEALRRGLPVILAGVGFLAIFLVVGLVSSGQEASKLPVWFGIAGFPILLGLLIYFMRKAKKGDGEK